MCKDYIKCKQPSFDKPPKPSNIRGEICTEPKYPAPNNPTKDRLKIEKDNCLKLREELIKCVLMDRRVYLSDLKLIYLKHLLRLDTGLINNDIEIINFYSSLATLNIRDCYDKLSTYKELTKE